MIHKRKEIKEKIVEMLRANVTENVYKSRYLPIGQKDFPAISVYIPEDFAEKNKSEEYYIQNAKTIINAYVSGKDDIELEDTGQDDIDDKLDDITGKIEAVFNALYQTLEGVVYRFNLVSTKYLINAEGDEIIGVAFMEFEAIYHTAVDAVGGIIPADGGIDHGDLQGLDDDDHPKYSLVDGTRDYSAIVKYNIHPEFTEDTEIVDKKYVDDNDNPGVSDHGELTGLGDDDHSKYPLAIRNIDVAPNMVVPYSLGIAGDNNTYWELGYITFGKDALPTVTSVVILHFHLPEKYVPGDIIFSMYWSHAIYAAVIAAVNYVLVCRRLTDGEALSDIDYKDGVYTGCGENLAFNRETEIFDGSNCQPNDILEVVLILCDTETTKQCISSGFNINVGINERL